MWSSTLLGVVRTCRTRTEQIYQCSKICRTRTEQGHCSVLFDVVPNSNKPNRTSKMFGSVCLLASGKCSLTIWNAFIRIDNETDYLIYLIYSKIIWLFNVYWLSIQCLLRLLNFYWDYWISIDLHYLACSINIIPKISYISGKSGHHNRSSIANLEGKILVSRYYLSNTLKKFPVNPF
jgi:hypothetical protein